MRKHVAAFAALALLIHAFSFTAVLAAPRIPLPVREPAAQGADHLLANLPDSQVVIVMNPSGAAAQAEHLLASKKGRESIVRELLARITKSTGVDVQSTGHMVAGFSIAEKVEQSTYLTLLSGTFSPDDILKALSEASGSKWKKKKYQGQRFYMDVSKRGGKKPKADQRQAIAFFDNNTVAAIGRVADIKKVVDVRSGTAPSAAANVALMTALEHTSVTAAIRFAFLIPQHLRDKLASLTGALALLRPLAAITEVRGSVDIGEAGVMATISLITGSEAEAGDVLNLINQGLFLAKVALAGHPDAELILELINGITVGQTVNVVNIEIKVSADLLNMLIDKIRGLTPYQR